MGTLAGFAPSTNGLHYPNSWPSEPDVKIATPFGSIPIGDASNGLCGGMAFAAADLFVARKLPPETDQNPPADSPAFNYIVRRLIDSFNIPAGVAEYYEWMVLGRADVGLGLVIHGTSYRTVEEELPKVRKAIESGKPCPLGLILVNSTNPLDLGKNHQVLAYAYEDTGSTTTVSVYDSNVPDTEVTITFSTAHPERGTTFAYSGNEEELFGFFAVPYTPADPSALFDTTPRH
jgi:hypothetical protein